GEEDDLYRSVTNVPLSSLPPAPASSRSKELLIGGKPVRFDEPRKYTAVALIFGLMVVGYGCFWGLHGLFKRIEDEGKKAAERKEARYQASAKASSEKLKALRSKSSTSAQSQIDPPSPIIAPSTPTQARTVAPAAAVIGEMEVKVEKAEL